MKKRSNPQIIRKPCRIFTDSDKIDILERYACGEGQRISTIAKIYDVYPSRIRACLEEWGAHKSKKYEPEKPYKAEPNPNGEKKKYDSTLDEAIDMLGTRVRVDEIKGGVKRYYLDDNQINPYYLIPAAGLCKGRAWV